MSYTLITSRNASAYTPRAQVAATFAVARPAVPVSDVIHWWGDPTAGYTHEGVVRQFETTPPGGSSAHYVLSAGLVTQLINEADASHANGHAAANAMTVTWECNPRCSAGDRETLAEALADVWIGRGRTTPGLVEMHKDYYATQCPGAYEHYLPAIRTRAAQLFAAKRAAKAGGTSSSSAQPGALPRVLSSVPAYRHRLGKKAYHTVRAGETLGAIARHYGNSVSTIAKWNKITNPDRIAAGAVLRVR